MTATATTVETTATDDAAVTAAAAATAAAEAASTAAAAETAATTTTVTETGHVPSAEKQPVVPETYALTLPEGTALDESDLQAVVALAKAKGWTNEEAQEQLQEQSEGLAAQRAKFTAALEAHPEIGGTSLSVTQARAEAVLDRFLPKDDPDGAALRTAFTKLGYGSYPPLVKLLARVGKAMGEDIPASGRGIDGGGARRSTAEVLFGDAKR